ncbi:type II toxin-antitoxin system ParD family antitoxin [Hellea sp.]|nr:type II toxin-antitoxin system ParD family antitoxin [Hellea sp.]
MPRTSISFTPPNEKWIQEQIDSEEFTSKSEVINDLIRRARRDSAEEIEAIRAALIKGEQSGISDRSLDDIWRDARKRRSA